MSWLNKLRPARIRTDGGNKRSIPEGLWDKCDGCGAVLYRPEVERNLYVCPKCSHHMPILARDRLALFLDEGELQEIGAELGPTDVLHFRDSKKYVDRIKASQKAVGESDALIAVRGQLKGMPLVAVAFEFRFMGGSMGSVVGERFALAAEAALAARCGLVCFSATGGARMQEGLFSLMQMAKTSAKLALLSEAGIPYVSLLTDPTTGGVTASFAMLGDFNIAEPGSLIGFAGPRVIKETIGKDLPKDFQSAEFVLEHGFLDFIVDRKELKAKLTDLFSMLRPVETPEPVAVPRH